VPCMWSDFRICDCRNGADWKKDERRKLKDYGKYLSLLIASLAVRDLLDCVWVWIACAAENITERAASKTA
jgi:hypothetical protein